MWTVCFGVLDEEKLGSVLAVMWTIWNVGNKSFREAQRRWDLAGSRAIDFFHEYRAATVELGKEGGIRERVGGGGVHNTK